MSATEVRLDFWGVQILVECSERTASHLGYYFSDYLSTRDRVGITHRLRIIGDLPGGREVGYQAMLDGGGGWTDIEPGDETILPPLAVLARRGWTSLHGSALAPPGDDRGLVILGDSTAGKSTLALELLRDGWRFLSDDTTVLDRDSNIVPFTRPIGVRERTAAAMPWIREYLREAPHFETPTGRTHMVSAASIGQIGSRVPWHWTLILCRGTTLSLVPTSAQTFTASCDLPRDVVGLAEALGQEVAK